MKHAASRRLLIWLVKWLHYVSNRQRQIISGQLRLTYPHPGVGEMSMSLTDWLTDWLTGWIWLILSATAFFSSFDWSFLKCLQCRRGGQKICSSIKLYFLDVLNPCVLYLLDLLSVWNLSKHEEGKKKEKKNPHNVPVFSHLLCIKFYFLIPICVIISLSAVLFGFWQRDRYGEREREKGERGLKYIELLKGLPAVHHCHLTHVECEVPSQQPLGGHLLPHTHTHR